MSAGTWALGYWPRAPDQTPRREGSSLLTPRRCQVLQPVCGGHWPVVALEREEAYCLRSVNSLPGRAARPAGGLWREHVLVWAGCLGDCSHKMLQWALSGSLPSYHPGKGADTVSSRRPDLCPDKETLGWELVGGAWTPALRLCTLSHVLVFCCPGGFCHLESLI